MCIPALESVSPNLINGDKLKEQGLTDPKRSNCNISSMRYYYNLFLAGHYWHSDMMAIDYNIVTKKIADYIVSYEVITKNLDRIEIYSASEVNTNGSPTETNETCREVSTGHKIPYFTELSFGTQKCFSMDMPFIDSRKIHHAVIKFNASIFKDGINPTGGQNNMNNDSFKLQAQRRWPKRDKRDKNQLKSYRTIFRVGNIEVLQYRKKYSKPCNYEPADYDQQTIQWITNTMGCELQFWNLTSQLPLCSSV